MKFTFRRGISFVIVLMLLMSILVGCNTQTTPDPVENPVEVPVGDIKNTEITIASNGNPVTMLSLDTRGANTPLVLNSMFDALVYRAPNGEFEPMLATEWEQIDDLTWEFKLREGVTFHNGEKFNAETVKYNLDVVTNPENNLALYPRMKTFVSCEILDEYTLRIRTEKPDPVALAKLSNLRLIPKEYTEEIGLEAFATDPVGTGPFKFVEWIQDDRVVVERFDDYWGGASDFSKVTYKIIPEPASRIAALKTGEVNLILNIDPDNYEDLSLDPNINLTVEDTCGMIVIDFNQQNTELGDNENFRLAVAHAINPDEIIRGLFKGFASALDRPMASNVLPAQPEELKRLPYDVEKAKEYLAAAGYPDGIDVDFDIHSGMYTKDREIAMVIAEQLRAVGINTNIIVNESGVFFDKMFEGAFTPLFLDGSVNSWMDPTTIVDGYFDGTTDYAFFDIPELAEYIRLGGSTVDPEERAAHYRDMYYYMVEHAVSIPILQYKAIGATSANLDWTPRPDSAFYLQEVSLIEK